MGTLRNNCTQTLITIEDIELLLQGCIPKKKLIVELVSSDDGNNGTVISTDECQMIYVTRSRDEGVVISKVEECNEDDKILSLRRRKINRIQTFDKKLKGSFGLKTQANLRQSAQRREPKVTDLAENNDNFLDTTGDQETELEKICGQVQENVKNESISAGTKLECYRIGDDITSLYKCCVCAKQFSNQKSLRAHSLIHNKRKEYSCETCGKQFLRAHELRLHMRIHTGERPFSCQFCIKSFTNRSALVRHQAVHNREKKVDDFNEIHRCHHCGKAFSQKGNLTVHMKIHTGTYDHVCPTCQKSFITSGDLKRHLRVHSKEKPYSCDMCKKSFTTSSSLVCHKRSHSGERPYLCGVCGASFSILGHLKQHNRIHARGDLWPRKKGASAIARDVPKNTNKENAESFPVDAEKNVDRPDENVGINCKPDDLDPLQKQTSQSQTILLSKLGDMICSDVSTRDLVILPQVLGQSEVLGHSSEIGGNGIPIQIKTNETVGASSVIDVHLSEKLGCPSTYTVTSSNHNSLTHSQDIDHQTFVDLSDSQLLDRDVQTGNSISCDIADIQFIITSCAEHSPDSEINIADSLGDATSESLYSNAQQLLHVKPELNDSCPVSICFINSQSPSVSSNALVQVVNAGHSIPVPSNNCQSAGEAQFTFPLSLSQATLLKGMNPTQLSIALDKNNITTTSGHSHNALSMNTDTRLPMLSVIQPIRVVNPVSSTSTPPVIQSSLPHQGALCLLNEDIHSYSNSNSTSQILFAPQNSIITADSQFDTDISLSGNCTDLVTGVVTSTTTSLSVSGGTGITGSQNHRTVSLLQGEVTRKSVVTLPITQSTNLPPSSSNSPATFDYIS